MKSASCLLGFILLLTAGTRATGDCSSTQCPEQLTCKYPNIAKAIRDPRNPECCEKIVCICKGTSNGLSSSSGVRTQYNSLLEIFTNCTHVDGNLEIVGIDGSSIGVEAIDATKHIEEVTGYVLISRVSLHHIDLSSLYLIRGESKYISDVRMTACASITTATPDNIHSYALYVSNNNDRSYRQTHPLRELWMPKLREITSGNIKFFNNIHLCYIDTILWDNEIVTSPHQRVSVDIPGNSNCEAAICPMECDVREVAGGSRCWGNSTNLCQTITNANCTSCPSRCSSDGTCCSDECAAGCYDNTTTSVPARRCRACKNADDDGECKSSCQEIGDNLETEALKPKKYQLNRHCVSHCPPNTPQSGQYCRTYCRRGSFDYENNICTECKDGVCENICYGIGVPDTPLEDASSIDASNIGHFNKNCTIIEGSLLFLRSIFRGDAYCAIPGLNRAAIFDVFQNVKEITGYLAFEAWPFNNICAFKNLKKIRGKALWNHAYSLAVYTNSRSLRNLCFNSLENIENGAIYIVANQNLCYADTINWDGIKKTDDLSRISGNREHCDPCHRECDGGCWGGRASQCEKCRNFMDYTNRYGKLTSKGLIDHRFGSKSSGNNITTCVSACDYYKGVYASSEKTCLPCHVECEKTCSGPGPFNCSRCKNVEFEGECISKCPSQYHHDDKSTCFPCSSNCVDGGCSGPLDRYGNNGCSFCHLSVNPETNRYTYIGNHCSKCFEHLKEQCTFGCTSFNNTRDWECYFPSKEELNLP